LLSLPQKPAVKVLDQKCHVAMTYLALKLLYYSGVMPLFRFVADCPVRHRILLSRCSTRSETGVADLAPIWNALSWLVGEIAAEFDALQKHTAQEHREYIELERERIAQRAARVKAARREV
jgi:hypothetical protein